MPIERSPSSSVITDSPTSRNHRRPEGAAEEAHDHDDATRVQVYANEFRNVKLSTFWTNKPRLWFAQLECEFTSYRIRADDVKYAAIVRHLDGQTMQIVADVLEQPPDNGKYETLKKVLIERFTDSPEKQLRSLLGEVEIGNKKPSVLLREMKSLAGSDVTDNVLRTLWLQRLPSRTQELLVLLADLDLSKLAACADKLWDQAASNPSISVVSNSSSTHESKQIHTDSEKRFSERLGELEREFQAFKVSRNRPRSRSQGPRRSPSHSRTQTRQESADHNGMCRYHRRYGERARRCTQPCSATYPLANPENSNSRRQ